MKRKKGPPPHVALRAVGGRPLPVAFEAAFTHRLTVEGIAGRIGRLRRRARPLPPEAVRGLAEHLAPLGLRAPVVHAVPHLPSANEEPALVLVVQEADEAAVGLLLARRGKRWLARPQLTRLIQRLDPEGAYLRLRAPRG